MGKRGKAARKRRRENEVDTAALASKLAKRSADCAVSAAAELRPDDGYADAAATAETGGRHGISDAALDATVATLRSLRGLVDPATGKLALRDGRYRGLRKVLYELQSCVSGGLGASGGGGGGSSTNSVATYLLHAESADAVPALAISSSRITREISAQIDNGAWEMAVATLRSVRMRREEHSQLTDTQRKNSNANERGRDYWRPKLGAVQRWIRQIDAAGTDDPLALRVMDAILRVVAPEAILPVEESDAERATWSRLGVSDTFCGGDDGKRLEGGSIRLFTPFDRRPQSDTTPQSNGQAGSDRVGTLAARMEVGEDGIRRIPRPLSNAHRGDLFRMCGHEKGADRKPPNRHDLELLTTAPSIEAYDDSWNTLSGEHVLHDDDQGRLPVSKSPLPYVQDSFLLKNVLSLAECDRLIAAAETAGYEPDEPLAGQPGASILAHACVWVVDRALERSIFERVKDFLPSYQQPKQKRDPEETETFRPLGLNRRFRFYRYVPGRYYRPHIDGAWPKSGFDGKGRYRYDVTDEGNKNGLQFVEEAEEDSSQVEHVENKDNAKQPKKENDEKTSPRATKDTRRQLSRLTFLIYLNDDFDGGHTTFLVPAREREGVLNAFPVNPIRGGVLVFPHGTCAAPLHEGSPVLKRCKYVVRTEVEYYK